MKEGSYPVPEHSNSGTLFKGETQIDLHTSELDPLQQALAAAATGRRVELGTPQELPHEVIGSVACKLVELRATRQRDLDLAA
jgi:hypothetical protein